VLFVSFVVINSQSREAPAMEIQITEDTLTPATRRLARSLDG
jgi:hypothetical protein